MWRRNCATCLPFWAVSDVLSMPLNCRRCGKPQPESTLVGGLCASCVAQGLRLDLLFMDEPGIEEKEPPSIQVQGYEIQALIGGGGMGLATSHSKQCSSRSSLAK